MAKKKYTEEMLDFAREMYKEKPIQDWIDDFIAKFGFKVSVVSLRTRINKAGIHCNRDTRYKKGCIPWSKGRKLPLKGRSVETAFGGVRSNAKHKTWPIGAVYIDHIGDVYVKISQPRNWKKLKIIVWEEVNGPVPAGMIVCYYDNSLQERLNPRIENLYLASTSEKGFLTTMRFNLIPLPEKKMAVSLARLQAKVKKLTDEGI